uniref:Uncharacterized protein n=1 Tax=Knipowitschia caucasica TaxID=637954 RepID=A0AAV2KY99_KNICA
MLMIVATTMTTPVAASCRTPNATPAACPRPRRWSAATCGALILSSSSQYGFVPSYSARRDHSVTIWPGLGHRRRLHRFVPPLFFGGEEALTIFVDKRQLSKKSEVSDSSGNSSAVTLETLHQLAASYFIDRESTLRKLHHIQIASTAIKVFLICDASKESPT